MTLLERMSAAASDPGAALEDLSEFFAPVLFRPRADPRDAAPKAPGQKPADNPLMAVRHHPAGSTPTHRREQCSCMTERLNTNTMRRLAVLSIRQRDPLCASLSADTRDMPSTASDDKLDGCCLHVQVHSLSLMIRQASFICRITDRIVERTSDALTPVAMLPLLPAPDAVVGVLNSAQPAPPLAASSAFYAMV